MRPLTVYIVMYRVLDITIERGNEEEFRYGGRYSTIGRTFELAFALTI